MKPSQVNLVFILSLFRLWSTIATPAPESIPSGASRLILLDVDNTLYRETNANVEAQIVDGTHSYCMNTLGMDKEEADELYRQFGSTVEGLAKTVWKDLSDDELEERLEDFYRAVYDSVDPSSILLHNKDADTGSTGYSHAKEERKLTRQLLKSSPLPVALASNSPSWHVQKVLRALGLARLSKDCEAFTPDRLPTYPTKNKPEEFFSVNGWGWGSSLSKYKSISFLDDSLHNLKRVKQAYPLLVDRVHQVNRDLESGDDNDSSNGSGEDNLVQALLQDFGLVDPAFHLSQTKYLESKNAVDRRSLHVGTWNKVVNELEELLQEDSDMWIVDLGAGLLSMLDLLLHGDDELGLSAFLTSSTDSSSKIIHYTAYESNQELYESSHERLLSWGFEVLETEESNEDDDIENEISNEDDVIEDGESSPDDGVEEEAPNEDSAIEMDVLSEDDDIENELSNEDKTTKIIEYQKNHNGVNLRVKLILQDFADVCKEDLSGIPETMIPNLIIGCCFADLMDPEQLVTDLLRSFGILGAPSSAQTRTLVYFPITFTGTTQFLPPQPFEFESNKNSIPSDTVGFQSYSRALEGVLGHNLNPFLLQEAMEDHGANLIDFGSSDWKIDPDRDSYLYETMLYFFGSTGGPQLLKEGWNAKGWIQRAHANKPNIQVSNRDLLFSIDPNNKIGNAENLNTQTDNFEEILFTAPAQVTSVKREFPQQLGPKQVLVRSSYSLISSGTELKIFKGLFDDDAALDVNIKDMEQERMAYPLSYGYCLVGVVVDCGSEVSREDFVGKTIFTFSPHATHVVTDADTVQIVPDGIDPQDAIFMPSVETALSLVHDANVRVGENIAVYGQGLIGLLVTALLSRGRSDVSSSGKFDSVTTFDMIPDRLAASSKMRASQALIPGKNSEGVQFDVSIEVSGNARALQSAIDNTVNGGRVIVGSWYGNKDVSLKLGIDFHRSHKTIQTSQVSEIPANLSQLWTKERRFAYTWDLVKQLKPGRLLTKVLPLESAQEAYEALDACTEIAIAFEYNE